MPFDDPYATSHERSAVKRGPPFRYEYRHRYLALVPRFTVAEPTVRQKTEFRIAIQHALHAMMRLAGDVRWNLTRRLGERECELRGGPTYSWWS